VNDVLYVANKE
jgi:hypothetical protein